MSTHHSAVRPDPGVEPLAMLAIVLAISLVGFAFGERVQAHGGLGWDGQTYAAIVRGLPHILWTGDLAPYYAPRILGPALVWAAIGADASNAEIIFAFGVLNLIAAFLSAVAWVRIANGLALSGPARWIGFAALFLNFPAAKLAQFYPVLVDSLALCVALWMLAMFLERRAAALFIVTVIAAFTHTLGAITGAVLLAFLDHRETIAQIPRIARRWLWVAAAAIAAGLLAYLLLLTRVGCSAAQDAAGELVPRLFDSEQPCGNLLELATGFPSIVIVALAACLLLRLPRHWPPPRRIALALLALLITGVVLQLIAGDAAGGIDIPTLLAMMLMPQAHKFLLPFVTQAVYWGPLAIIAVLLWPSVALQAKRLGFGMVAVMLGALPFVLVTEPRFLNFSWPFIVVCTVLALDTRGVSRSFAWLFIAVAVAFSKAWLPINYAVWTGSDDAALDQFPKQLFFMNFGYWMNWETFLAQAAAVCLAAMLFWITQVRSEKVRMSQP